MTKFYTATSRDCMSEVVTQPAKESASPAQGVPASQSQDSVTTAAGSSAAETHHAPVGGEAETQPTIAPVDNATVQTHQSGPQGPTDGVQSPAAAMETGLDVGKQGDLSKVSSRDEYLDLMRSLQTGTIDPAALAASAPAPAPAEPAAPVEPAPAQSGRRPEMKLPLPPDPELADITAQAVHIQREHVKKGKSITLTQAEALARAAMGLDPVVVPGVSTAPTPPVEPVAAAAAAAPAPAEHEVPDEQAPPALAEIDAQLEDLRELRRQALLAYNNEELARLDGEIEPLQDQRFEAVLAEREARVSRQTFEQRWTRAVEKTVETFPAAADPQSALSIVARAISAEWQAAGDARMRDPDSAPSAIYAEAAKRMGVQPAAPAAPAASPTTLPTSQPVHRPAAASIIAGGNAGTTAPAAVAPATQFGRINNPLAYDNFVESLRRR